MNRPVHFTDQQLDAIGIVDNHCAVLAIPGSGKTELIKEKIARRLEGRRRVGALTFTASAADELVRRVAKRVGAVADGSFIGGTFHSLVLHKLRDSPASGLGNRRIAKPGVSEQYMKMALQKVDLKPSKTNLDRFDEARSRINDPFGIERAEENATSDLRSQEVLDHLRSIKAAVEYYEARMQAAGLIDFSGVMCLALQHANNGHPVFEVDDLLVDEAQDVDEVQLALIMKHADFGTRIDIVGDDDQSIYGFRQGMGYKGLVRFVETLRADDVRLTVNFRCKREILDWAGQVIEQNQERKYKKLFAHRGPGGKTRLAHFDDGDQEIAFAAEQVGSLLAGNAKSIAVIARQNALLDEVETVLTEQDIPYARSRKESFWDCNPVFAVLAFLQCVADPGREVAGLEVLLNVWGATAQDLEILRQEASGGSLQRLVLEWDSEASSASILGRDAMSILSNVCRRLGYPDRPFGREAVDELLSAAQDACLDSFTYLGTLAGKKMEEIESTENKLNAAFKILLRMQGSLAQRLSRVSTANRVDGDGALTLMTMHGSKGREFDHVYVVGCDDDTVPGKNAADVQVEEECRLLYVAMTRAKNCLTLTYSRRYRVKGGFRDTSRSQLLRISSVVRDEDGSRA